MHYLCLQAVMTPGYLHRYQGDSRCSAHCSATINQRKMKDETNILRERIVQLEKENFLLKQQQIEITEAKELYLKIFDDFPALIWRSRLDKLCDYFNKTWLEFTGRSMEQEFGNGWAEGVHPDDFDFCVQTYVAAFDRREAFLMEYRMKNARGEYRWIRDFGRPFFDLDNTFLGYIGSCYDITEIKDNELRLTELNITKDKFFSIIAHDLRSPFNAIIGFSQHLLTSVEEKRFDEMEEYARIIMQSSNRAMELLTNLMQWSQSQSGRLQFHPEPFDMANLIREWLPSIHDLVGLKSIIIEIRLPEVAFVNADIGMISTVLRNLTSNAIKFTHPGGQILIALETTESECFVSVKDNGVGIKKERIDSLFCLNKSCSTQGTLRETGTGLGLILCKEFVEKNGGILSVESVEGVGSTFTFSLPLARS